MNGAPKTLVLFDADQDWTMPPPILAPPTVNGREVREVVVVLGMNTAAVLRRKVSLTLLEDLARGAACQVLQVGGHRQLGRLVTEVVLTLVAPETTDAALVRMLRQAASIDGAGPFDEIWLASGDSGLRHALNGAVGPSFLRERRPFQVTGLPAYRWMARRRARLDRRGAKEGHTGSCARLVPAGPTIVIDQPGLAAWAAGQAVQARQRTLVGLAREVERLPSLLTQVGSTRKTARGAARLAKVALPGTAVPSIGVCHSADGLELLVFSENGQLTDLSGLPTSAQPSSLGTGAVRLVRDGPERQILTARTKLPFWVVREAVGACWVPTARPASIADRSLLRALGPAAGGMMEVTVRFWPRPADPNSTPPKPPEISCELFTDPKEPELPTWWYDGTADPMATVKFVVRSPALANCLPNARRLKEVAARPAVDATRGSLFVRSLVPDSGVMVDVPWLIDRATMDLVIAGTRQCAMMALASPVGPGRVICTPIQQWNSNRLSVLTSGRIAPEVFDRLKRLPIVVPLAAP